MKKKRPKILLAWKLRKGVYHSSIVTAKQLCGEGLVDGIEIRIPSHLQMMNFHGQLAVFREVFRGRIIRVHAGANGDGFDPGECHDGLGVAKKLRADSGISWRTLNSFIIFDSYLAASELRAIKPIVVHPGHRLSPNDQDGLSRAQRFLSDFCDPRVFALETLPALKIGSAEKVKSGEEKPLWSIGGRPSEMKMIREIKGWKVLPDFSHLWVSHQQALQLADRYPELQGLADFEKTINAFRPFTRACHFSGLPEGIKDGHVGFSGVKEANPLIKQILCREMDYVVIELSIRDKEANGKPSTRDEIACFKELYLS